MTTLKKPRGRAGGRKPAPLADRKPRPNGKIAVVIAPETALLAQRLMLYDWPGVKTPEDLFAYALRRLAETTDD